MCELCYEFVLATVINVWFKRNHGAPNITAGLLSPYSGFKKIKYPKYEFLIEGQSARTKQRWIAVYHWTVGKETGSNCIRVTMMCGFLLQDHYFI